MRHGRAQRAVITQNESTQTWPAGCFYKILQENRDIFLRIHVCSEKGQYYVKLKFSLRVFVRRLETKRKIRPLCDKSSSSPACLRLLYFAFFALMIYGGLGRKWSLFSPRPTSTCLAIRDVFKKTVVRHDLSIRVPMSGSPQIPPVLDYYVCRFSYT